jgi:hypothetical protein
MVNMDNKLLKIKSIIDDNENIMINRPRQFGKSTTLSLLRTVLEPQYAYLSITLEGISRASFTEELFCDSLASKIINKFKLTSTGLSEDAQKSFITTIKEKEYKSPLINLNNALLNMCIASDKRIVFAIDEIDKAADQDIFIDFLSALRGEFIGMNELTFQSVILSGVSDIRNLKSNMRPDSESTGEGNSPWNIAISLDIDMSLAQNGINAMLEEYKADHGLTFDTTLMSGLLWEHTSGYPYLVSKLCQIIHSNVPYSNGFGLNSAWTREGFANAVMNLRKDRRLPLLDSLRRQTENSKELRSLLKDVLSSFRPVEWQDAWYVEKAIKNGFLAVDDNDKLKVSNMFFESWLNSYLKIDGLSFEDDA